MANTLKQAVAELFAERGEDFNRADKQKLDELLLLEPNLDQAHDAESSASEALRLIVGDPLYTGDLTFEELG